MKVIAGISRTTICILLASLGLATGWAKAADEGPAELERKIDRIVGRAMNLHQIPGMIIGVVDGGQVVLKKGYGVKALPGGRPPDENTVFALGSVSKAL